MSRELVIEATAVGLRAGLMADGRLVEVALADADRPSVRGQVFLGRVRALDHALDAAFVDCGLGEPGYLAARDARHLGGRRRLVEGQAVIVQGRRDAQGGKGPRLTGDIALAGPCLIYRPRRQGDGLSQRPAARRADRVELDAEALRLRRLWQAIESAARTVQPPARLHGPQDPIAWLMAEQLGADPERILVADQTTLLRARNYLAEWRPGVLERLELLPGAFAASGAEEQLAAALEPVVPLEGGGAIIIQGTAALTAIDVDGGARRPLEVDLAAAGEIARQLRLRQIGGTIAIDFVDLGAKADRAKLLQTLRAALAGDPATSEVLPMSAFGLVQVSRRRLGPSLAEQLGRACPTCGGGGLLPSLRRCSEALMDELARRPRAAPGARVAPDLHAHLTGAAATVWQTFGARQGSVLPLQIDPRLAPGGYRIEEAR